LKSGGQWIEMRQRLPGVLCENDYVMVMDAIDDTRKNTFQGMTLMTAIET
jgi:hypothetical protein